MRDAVLSYITDAPVSYSVYSAFSFYGTRRGGVLSGPWLVAALSALGHEEATVRQTLYRMVADGELDARRTGRIKHYRLTRYAEAEVRVGTEKIFTRAPHWDGQWTLLHLRFEADERLDRERVRSVLQVEGYASVGPGLLIHPHDTGERVLEAVRVRGFDDRVLVVRGRRIGALPDREFVRRYWAIDHLAARYQQFLRAFRPIARSSGKLSDRACFQYRFAVALAFLEIAWSDPGLPLPLLPPDWPGEAARSLTQSLYDRLLPGALSFGDSVLASAHGTSTSRRRAPATKR